MVMFAEKPLLAARAIGVLDKLRNSISVLVADVVNKAVQLIEIPVFAAMLAPELVADIMDADGVVWYIPNDKTAAVP